ncbi:hypothetical protein KW782_03875 [Candidatus Parcubacteria bacterium]|nr:hypothetical protein [Candidatus Parcubacteria bacterium]
MGHKSHRKRAEGKEARATKADADLRAATGNALPALKFKGGSNDDWVKNKIFVKFEEIANLWRTQGAGLFTVDAWKKYTSPAEGRDPLCAWWRPDDAIRVARVYGTITEAILDAFVSEDSRPLEMVCRTSVIEYKLPLLTAENRRRAALQSPEPPVSFKDIHVPEEDRRLVKFTAVRVVTLPTNAEKKRDFLDSLKRVHESQPGNALAGLYESGQWDDVGNARFPWSIMGAIFVRPKRDQKDQRLAEKLPMRGAPWFVEFNSGRILPRRGSLLKEQFDEKFAEGYRLRANTTRFGHVIEYHRKLVVQRNAAERRELREFHDQAAEMAWKMSDADIGLDEFSFNDYEQKQTETPAAAGAA